MDNNENSSEPLFENRITMNHLPERQYWCERFQCSMEELIEAVNNVGVSSEAVEKYLKTHVER